MEFFVCVKGVLPKFSNSFLYYFFCLTNSFFTDVWLGLTPQHAVNKIWGFVLMVYSINMDKFSLNEEIPNEKLYSFCSNV